MSSADRSGALPPNGYIDFFGYLGAAGGWLLCGWITDQWTDGLPVRATLQFDARDVPGDAACAFFSRSDLGQRGVGLLAFVPAEASPAGRFRGLVLEADDTLFRVEPTAASTVLDESELQARTGALLAASPPGPGRALLQAQLSRQGFAGRDTMADLSDQVRINIDESFFLPPAGLALAGWLAAAPGVVRSVRLRSGSAGTVIDASNSIRVDREDVVDALVADGVLADRRCGFVAALPDSVSPGDPMYLEIETARGETGYALLPPQRLRGFAAMRRLLQLVDVRYADVAHAFDHVVGPAVRALNAERLAIPPQAAITDFGSLDTAPTYSVIVPLYGRVDFLESQMAMFSRHGCAGHEFIYVLDNPDQTRETQQLAESVFARFGVPFRLVVLERNVGYGPANNIALAMVRAPVVCFLNSDVFPTSGDWLPRLAEHLARDDRLGAVGPLLLFEDGSVQHQGIVMEAQAQFGGWMFPDHPRKGWKPERRSGLSVCQAITGACMVMRTHQARTLNGFDEAYAIGDFEDTDLCLRLARSGLTCAVDLDVRLHHLERRSQVDTGQLWRTNLTLYNAWLHQRRWFGGHAPGPVSTVPPDAARKQAARRRSRAE